MDGWSGHSEPVRVKAIPHRGAGRQVKWGWSPLQAQPQRAQIPKRCATLSAHEPADIDLGQAHRKSFVHRRLQWVGPAALGAARAVIEVGVSNSTDPRLAIGADGTWHSSRK